jgi:hypothetical protein
MVGKAVTVQQAKALKTGNPVHELLFEMGDVGGVCPGQIHGTNVNPNFSVKPLKKDFFLKSHVSLPIAIGIISEFPKQPFSDPPVLSSKTYCFTFKTISYENKSY